MFYPISSHKRLDYVVIVLIILRLRTKANIIPDVPDKYYAVTNPKAGRLHCKGVAIIISRITFSVSDDNSSYVAKQSELFGRAELAIVAGKAIAAE